MDWYLIIKTVHILSATALLGTGLGIAFFMFRAHATAHLQEKYFAARNTVLADTLFTLPAVILQPLSGAWLVWKGGYDWAAPWLLLTYGLFVLAGFCWLPVFWIQLQLKTMIAEALHNETGLPGRYHRLFKLWFLLGWPAFLSLILVFFLMVLKPA